MRPRVTASTLLKEQVSLCLSAVSQVKKNEILASLGHLFAMCPYLEARLSKEESTLAIKRKIP